MSRPAASIDTCRLSAHDGLAMCCDHGGHGQPLLLFVHGWTCRRAYWSWQLKHFATDWRVAALDLPGHGESPANGRKDWSVAALARDVAACARELDAAEVILIGHSMGGAVALEAARLLSAQARGVILADTFVIDYGGVDADTAQTLAAPFEADFAGAIAALVEQTATAATPEDLKRRLVREMSTADPAWALPLWRDLLAWTPAAAFAELRIPLHAINGDLIPDSARQRCAPYVLETLLPGAGHFLQLENPEAFNRALTAILSS